MRSLAVVIFGGITITIAVLASLVAIASLVLPFTFGTPWRHSIALVLVALIVGYNMVSILTKATEVVVHTPSFKAAALTLSILVAYSFFSTFTGALVAGGFAFWLTGGLLWAAAATTGLWYAAGNSVFVVLFGAGVMCMSRTDRDC